MRKQPAHRAFSKLTETGFRIFFFVCLAFAVLSAFYNYWLSIGEIILVMVLYFYLRSGISHRRAEMAEYIESMSTGITNASRGTMINAPLPVVIFHPDTDDIIWSNERFLDMVGDREHLFDTKLSTLVPNFQTQWLLDGDTTSPEEVTVGKGKYLVFGNLVNTGGTSEYMAITYWVEITEYAEISERFHDTRPVMAILQLDNYEDLVRGVDDTSRTLMLNEINSRITQWLTPAEGMLIRYDRDHYFLLVEAGKIADFYRRKFSILDDVRQVQNPSGINATLSIGIGQDADNPQQLYQFAQLAIDMALSRGGDQVVAKDGEKFYFIGGRSKETERRTKVKSRVMASALSELLNTANLVLVMGHQYPDLDVLGSAVGVCAIARKKGVPVRMVQASSPYPAEEQAKKIAALPEYQGAFLTPEEARFVAGPDTMLVVVDTNRPEQTQVPELLEICKRVVVVDHHRRAASYIENTSLNFHDPYASSACELTAELVQYILDPGDLKRAEAEVLLSGIVLDTKGFTSRTGSRTFETAAFLRRAGADTGDVQQFFKSSLEDTVARLEIIRGARAYHKTMVLADTDKMVGRAIAGQAADQLLEIAGIEASFVLFPEEGQFCLSARSNSSVNVQVISEMLGGGGNAAVAGAQFPGQGKEEVEAALIDAIDRYFADET